MFEQKLRQPRRFRARRSTDLPRWSVLAAIGWSMLVFTGDPLAAETISFGRRVEARQRVEEFRAELRGGRFAGDAAALVEHDDLEAGALAGFWNVNVSDAEVQLELNRMARSSRRPEKLRELFSRLNCDADLIADAVVRPILVRRELEARFPSDDRIHGDQRARLERLALSLRPGELSRGDLDGQWQPISLSLDAGASADQLRAAAASLGDPGPHVGLVERTDDFLLVDVHRRNERELIADVRRYPKRSLDEWVGEQPPPKVRQVPTSSEIILPDEYQEGSFSPNSWSRREPDSPTARYDHTAVWTGSEMIVWGGHTGVGVLSSGSRYDPITNTWRSTRNDGTVATARSQHIAIWTGDVMIVFGGEDGARAPVNNGYLYDPENDSWRPMAAVPATAGGRAGQTAVWNGSQMIVFGGKLCTNAPTCTSFTYFQDGGLYSPYSNSWSAMGTIGAPSARAEHVAVWAGDRMVIFGGTNCANTAACAPSSYLGDGFTYSPSTSAWAATDPDGDPTPRAYAEAVWTGERMIVWGGLVSTNTVTNTGGHYDPKGVDDANSDGKWVATSTSGAVPTGRQQFSAVWTGASMLVWGGLNGFGSAFIDTSQNSGGAFTPNSLDGSWDIIEPAGANVPSPRAKHSAVWSGSAMIIWGGIAQGLGNVTYGSGGRYDPSLTLGTRWQKTAEDASAAEDRTNHTTVWTGSELLVWGGKRLGAPLQSGSKYDPLFDTWTLMGTGSAPSARYDHVAVWTGTKMLAWGGRDNSAAYNTGGAYDPTLNTWTAMTTTGAPSARHDVSAVWTGSEMIVWGGRTCTAWPDCSTANVYGGGFAYTPGVSDSWSAAINASGAPGARFGHSAIWTGTEMVIWGGRNNSTGRFQDGAVYSRSGNAWWSMTSTGAPAVRAAHTAVWTGTQMIVWGGEDSSSVYLSSGGVWSRNSGLGTDSWSATPTAPMLGRFDHSAIWTGHEMIVWGGTRCTVVLPGCTPSARTNDGARWRPGAASWNTTPLTFDTPRETAGHGAVWTGDAMIVSHGDTPNPRDLGFFFPDTPPTALPELRVNGSVASSLIFGGSNDTVGLSHTIGTSFIDDVEDGSSFDDSTDTWHVVEAESCSDASDYYSAISAWRFGSSETCGYGGSPTGTFLLEQTTAVANVAANAVLELRSLLELSREGGAGSDIAKIEAWTTTDGWVTVAIDSRHTASGAIQMQADEAEWRALTIPLDRFLTLPGSVKVRFSLYRADTEIGPRSAAVGWLVDDIAIGHPSGDGSIPSGTTVASDGSRATIDVAYHDRYDSAAFEWDVDGDGVADNTDTSTPVFSIPESATLPTLDLSDYGLDSPGNHDLTLTVRDAAGVERSNSVTLNVVDGIAPTVALLTPNGGESWPAESTQTISWTASDNHALSGFKLYHVVEELVLPTSSLPATLAEGVATDFFFDVPSAITVQNVTLDVEMNWGSPEASLSVQLTNCNPSCAGGTSVLLQSGASPLTNFTSISGNWDRSLATFASLSAFDGQASGSQWRVSITDTANGNAGTVKRLRLFLASDRDLIATIASGTTRSYEWNPLPSTPTTRNRIEIVAEDQRSPTPNSATDDSDETFYISQANADSVRTLVAWNRARTAARYGTADADDLEAKLLDYIDHAKVDGVLLDLSSGAATAAGVTAAYSAWDAAAWNDTQTSDNAVNVGLANVAAQAIRTFLFDQISTNYVNLESLVLVGGDDLVPFVRFDDSTSRQPETGYIAELQALGRLGGASNTTFCQETQSPMMAATCANFYFSDTPYGASSTTSVLGSSLTWYLPDLAVGRLVETPEQIRDLVDMFLTQDGVTEVDKTLTTGYDFLTDGGDEVHSLLTSELNSGSTTMTRLSQTYSPSWTATELENHLFGLSGQAKADLSFVFGHADHRAEGAASAADGELTSLEMDDGTSANDGGVVIGVGCHTGTSVLADGGSNDDTSSAFLLDLPELFAKKRFPVFVGNGGYGWGLSEGIGLGETLVALTAEEIVSAGQVAVGEAHRLAKQEYFLRESRLDSYDHKVLHESILYGLPTYDVRVNRAAPLVAGTERASWAGKGLSRKQRRERLANGPRNPGKVWLGDPHWTEQELPSGRKLRKSEPMNLAVPSPVEAAPTSDPATLRVLEFEYQAYQSGQNTDALPPSGTTTWTASTGYLLGAKVKASVSTGFYYTATVAGTSGSAEPAWPTSTGATVVDGGVTWTTVASTDDWEEAYQRQSWCTDASGESQLCTGADGTVGVGQTAKIGTYFTLDGLATGDGGLPVQPQISFDSKLYGTEQHGVIVTGGEFVQPLEINPLGGATCTDEFSTPHRCFDPVVGNPETKADQLEGPASTAFVSFSRPTAFVSFSRPTPNGYTEGTVDANVTPTRFDTLNSPMGETVRRGVREPTPGNRYEIFSEWLYRTRRFTQFYANSSDWTAPVIGAVSGDCSSDLLEPGNDCYSSLSGLRITFDVPVTEETSPPGIYKVFVTYHSDVDSTYQGEWQSLELTDDDGNGRYTGSIDVLRSTTYMIQAVDWSGNVGTVLVTGNDVDSSGNSLGSQYRLARLYTVDIADSDGDGLPDYYETPAEGLDPNDSDSDNDGIADAADDLDHDGLSNVRELELGYDPSDSDVDDDGDNDGSELNNSKQPLVAGDGNRLSIALAASGSDVQVKWYRGTDTGLAAGTACSPINGTTCLAVNDNDNYDGYFRVYVSSDPRFSTDDYKKGPNDVNGGGDDLDNFDQRTNLVTQAELPAALQSAPVLYYQVMNWDIDAPAPLVEYVGVNTAASPDQITIYGQYFDPDSADAVLCESATTCNSAIVLNIVAPTSVNRNESRILAAASTGTPAVAVPSGSYYVGVRNGDGLIDIWPVIKSIN